MTLFENVTRTRVKDSFVDDNDLLTFVVDQQYIGKAIGKGARNVKKLEKLLKRRIKIVAYNDDVEQFVTNLIYPIEAEVEHKDDTIIIRGKDSKTKGMLIGRNRSNVNNTLKIVQKYFNSIEKINIV